VFSDLISKTAEAFTPPKPARGQFSFFGGKELGSAFVQNFIYKLRHCGDYRRQASTAERRGRLEVQKSPPSPLLAQKLDSEVTTIDEFVGRGELLLLFLVIMVDKEPCKYCEPYNDKYPDNHRKGHD
jgi:hypothetical protein